MLDRILEYMKKYNMVEPGDGIVVGVSGGADSLALLHILNRISPKFSLRLAVAHVHHGLRGKEADEDADFVEEICRSWQIPFFIKKADVRGLARDWGISEEEAGRKIRYQFFEEILEEIKGQKIALAHHRDDQAETILYHLIRGTGLKGLQGMKPVRDGRIIRPLLQISRREIEDYCRSESLQYRIDATNEDIVYTRNRIRNVVIPYIQSNFNPGFSESLARMGDILREEDEFLSCYSEEIFNKWVSVSNKRVDIPLDILNKSPKAIRRRIIRLAVEMLIKGTTDISYVHVEQVLNMAMNSSTGSELDLPGSLRAKKEYGSLILLNEEESQSIPPFQYPLLIPGKVFIDELGIEIECEQVGKPDVLYRGPWCIYLDRDKIQGSLWVRNRRDGDRFQPLGMKGTKKLKDYLIDRKVPRSERDAIPLVVDEGGIIWVAGYQLSENYKITQNTRNIVQLKMNVNSKIIG